MKSKVASLLDQRPWTDPVEYLGLEGKLLGSMPCPHMIKGRFRWSRGEPCGEQAMLFQYPFPYGLRIRCEDGHVTVAAPTAVPGRFRDLKGETD